MVLISPCHPKKILIQGREDRPGVACLCETSLNVDNGSSACVPVWLDLQLG